MNAKLLKYKNVIYQNFSLKVVTPDGQKFYPVLNPENPDEVKDAIIETLNHLTDRYFYDHAAGRGDYRNMGEIYVDAQNNDPDAQYLSLIHI